MGWLRRSVLSLCLLVVAGCGGGSPSPSAADLEVPSWSLPSDPMALARQAGLTPEVKEFVDYHVHAHLDVFVNGARVKVPGGIGIEITDPAVIKFGEDHYGGIPEEGCEQVCISPVHTHDADGIIHVEAPATGTFTLGQFFQEMAVRLDASCVDEFCAPDTPVVVYLNGQPHSGNPADIAIGDLQEIAIVIGTPPAVIPDSFSGEP
jgi:hypothetical protein